MRCPYRSLPAIFLLIPPLAFAAGTGYSWTGAYAGIRAGFNRSTIAYFDPATGLSASGIAGYEYEVAPRFVIGGNVFLKWSQAKNHTYHYSHGVGSDKRGDNSTGVGVLFGFPAGTSEDSLPYLKLGYGWATGTGDISGHGSGFRYGAGVE